MKLYTNSNYRRDYFQSVLEERGRNCSISIASAFFDNSQLVETFLNKNCKVRLLIRLGEGTNEIRIKDIINQENIQIRYFSSTNFHPKFYIFHNQIAFLGSSNLTVNGGISNREANISIEFDSEIYNQLNEDFEMYWANARVLDDEVLNKYIEIKKEFSDNNKEENDKKKKLKAEFGDDTEKIFSVSIDKNMIKNNVKNYVENYKKTYQNFLNEFSILEKIYRNYNKRKVSEKQLPLRIEIDQLFNWIRENKCKGEVYRDVLPKDEVTLEKYVIENIEEFIQSKNDYFEYIVEESYPLIYKAFITNESIDNLDEDKLKEALKKIHAFHSRERFFQGGLDSLYREFLEKNGFEKIKKSFKYILHGTGDYKERLAIYQFNEEYKLHEFAESCSKELFGWVNNKNVPIYNFRTYIGMKWLGFNL